MLEKAQLKQQILNALGSSFQADQDKLRLATDYFAEMSKTAGYCMTLMEIVDDTNISETLKQAALIQLKNTIKRYWMAKNFEIEISEKEKIKQILIVAMTRCSKSHKLIKLYKQVFTIIVGHEYKTWLPIQQILTKIRADEDLVPTLQALIAIASSFEFSITQDERNYFFQFLNQIFPDLNSLRQRNTNSEIIYLITKFLWKAFHYELNYSTKQNSLQWMDLIAMIVNLNNPDFDNHIDQPQTKNTPQFFYFHTKKWATRILLRFIQKHAKATSNNKNLKDHEFSQYWYSNFGQKFIEILIHQFQIPTATKVRYFQLKCIQTLANQKPNQIQQFAKVFQQNILPKFMTLKPEDEETAQADPLQFLAKESQPSIDFTNLKRIATDAWISFAQLGSAKEKKNSPFKPGIFFYDNMRYLKGKLQSKNLIEKQMAMYLICELNSPIMKCKQIRSQLPNWIGTYIIPQFSNEVMFLRARAVDIFFQYGTIQNLPFEVIQQATQGIYNCLNNDHYPLVRIKAANAFNCILRHKNAKQLVKPLLQNILAVYLQLLEKYDLQSIVNSLQSIIEGFADQIGPFAVDLGRCLSKLFMKMFQRDIEQSTKNDYDGQTELAAAGCLDTFTRIINAPISQECIVGLEFEVVSLCEFVFSSDSIDYIEDILVLLNSYLHRVQIISPSLSFYYQVIIYNIVGIPKSFWDLIPNLLISQKQKTIFNNIKNSQNLEMIEQSMPVLRNFIKKSSTFLINGQDVFQINLIQLLFYLVNEIYKKGPNEYSGEIYMNCCTALLIYLLQNNKETLPHSVYSLILTIVKYNITKAKSKTLRILNSQLQGLLIWINPNLVLDFIQKQKIQEPFIKELLSYQNKYSQEHERQRMILGLSCLLRYQSKPLFLSNLYGQIFKTLIKLVKKNAEERIQEAKLQGQEKSENQHDEDQEEEDFNNSDFGSDEGEEFWQEQYDDNYESPLMTVDQIQFFEHSIHHVQSTQSEFYNHLLKAVSQEDLLHISEIVQKAKASLNPLKPQ